MQIDFKKHSKDIINSKKNNKILLIKNFCNEVSSWGNFINIIDNNSDTPDKIKIFNKMLWENDNEVDKLPTKNEMLSGNILIKECFYMHIDIVNKTNIYLNSVEEIENGFNREFGINGGLTNSYLNLTKNISNTELHKDETDNFYWQNIGSVEWITKNESFIVNPGDLVFIPSGVHHGVNLFEPRASLGFIWDLDKVLTSTNI